MVVQGRERQKENTPAILLPPESRCKRTLLSGGTTTLRLERISYTNFKNVASKSLDSFRPMT